MLSWNSVCGYKWQRCVCMQRSKIKNRWKRCPLPTTHRSGVAIDFDKAEKVTRKDVKEGQT